MSTSRGWVEFILRENETLSAGVELNSFCMRMKLCRQARIQFNLGSIASNVWQAYLHRRLQRNSCFTRLRTFYRRPPWATFWGAWGAQKAVAAAQLRRMLGVSGAPYQIIFPKRANVRMVDRRSNRDWRNDRVNVITKGWVAGWISALRQLLEGIKK